MHNAGHIVGFVALLVLGIAAVQALIWVPIIVWWRRRTRGAQAALAAAIGSDAPIRQPEKGVYRGSTAPGYPVVHNNGSLALTKRRLIFVTVTGTVIDIPVTEIIGAREDKVFKASVQGGRLHLVVRLRSGEVAFYVASSADWLAAIAELVRPPG